MSYVSTLSCIQINTITLNGPYYTLPERLLSNFLNYTYLLHN